MTMTKKNAIRFGGVALLAALGAVDTLLLKGTANEHLIGVAVGALIGTLTGWLGFTRPGDVPAEVLASDSNAVVK